MRIVVDMQGVQSTASRARGIGRYTASLAQAIVRNRGEHDIILALNGHFPDAVETIRNAFNGLLPPENIRVWEAPGPLDYINAPQWRRDIAETMREYCLAHLKPDAILLSSLFEGLIDNAVTSIHRTANDIPTAVILYDLIPYIYRETYLENPVVEAWYLGKLDHLRRADLLLAISESSRQESIRHLGIDEHAVVNISTAVSAQFSPRKIPGARWQELSARYGLTRPPVMYTGGIDHRKNVEGLIRAYANLPQELRRDHQLAIVCSVHENDRRRLTNLARQHGLKKNELVITGFVPDEDLIDLYNLCAVFVFPSLHEGFGLPVLEAMSCGAPVIASNVSSLPEVVGRSDALFDPHDDRDVTGKLSHALGDETFRQALARHALEQARRFSWDTTAQRALAGLERCRQDKARRAPRGAPAARPKLAFLSPLPPERSGISDYSAELLRELGRYYEIEVVVTQQAVSDPYVTATFPIRTVEWFRDHADEFDRVVYQFGNSAFHQHMFALLRDVPGVVVLHDFFLSGVIAYMDASGLTRHGFAGALYAAHGYEAVRELFHARSSADVIYRYPCNLGVLQQAQGIIVHSRNSIRLAEQWYGGSFDWVRIPHFRHLPAGADRATARSALGLAPSDFVVCSFGLLGPPKLNQRLLQAWLQSALARDPNCRLVFVGENDAGEYGQTITATIRRHRVSDTVRITGWADEAVFRRYLAAADLAVQLRTFSRGETSAAVYDCMSYGLPMIVNANGSMAELEDDAVWKLPDAFTDAQLVEALEALWQDAELRGRLGLRAREIILERHSPAACAAQYHEAIERFARSSASGTHALASAIAALDCTLDERDLSNVARAIAQNMPPLHRAPQVLVDVSPLVEAAAGSEIERIVRGVVTDWLLVPPPGVRVEPVRGTEEDGHRYARRFALGLLGCPGDALDDDNIEFAAGDIFIGLCLSAKGVVRDRAFFRMLRVHGVQVYFVVYDLFGAAAAGPGFSAIPQSDTEWLDVVAESDGALCLSKTVAGELTAWLKAGGETRQRPFTIECLQLGAGSGEGAATTSGRPVPVRDVIESLAGARPQRAKSAAAAR